MGMATRVWSSMVSTLVMMWCIAIICCSFVSIGLAEVEEGEIIMPIEIEHVLTLDYSNFSKTVNKHDFIVVEFYAPWCGHCQELAPEYERAASILSSHDPPIILAKVDASDEANKKISRKFEVKGFPTLKILRDGGKSVQDYKGPREADEIVAYLKKQLGPASKEIKSVEDAARFIDENDVITVGVFPEFTGEEYENFTIIAEKMRSEHDFCHTLDAKLLPRGNTSVVGPTIRLLKPFDELVVDFQNFEVDVVEKFIEDGSVPNVVLFDDESDNHPYLMKFFKSDVIKGMLFVNFSSEDFDALKSKYHDVAVRYKGEGIRFLLGDVEASSSAFQFFGLKQDQAPVMVVQKKDGMTKYVKSRVQPQDIAPMVKDFMDGKLRPHLRSEPIPEVNDGPVKVVVAHTLHDMVIDSGKNVLVLFYASWSDYCKQLATVLDEVAVSFENDPDVFIAKIEATKNDIPRDFLDVKGFPTLVLKSASGKLIEYDGKRTEEDIVDFVQKNREETNFMRDEL